MSFGGFLISFFIYLVMMLMILPYGQERHKNVMELYMPQEKRKRMAHKPRMKYITGLSCEEVLLRFKQMYTPFDCTFKKENDDIKDQMYILSIDEVPQVYQGTFRGKVRYKVLVTPAQKGSTVWLFLFTYDRMFLLDTDLLGSTRVSDDDMLSAFAWEVEKLFEKLLDAVRVE